MNSDKSVWSVLGRGKHNWGLALPAELARASQRGDLNQAIS